MRERVGPEMVLMLDPHHDYSRKEALYLGRAIEELDFRWLEEPMNEHSVSSYVWLAQQLDIAVVGPESAEGKMQTRAEWIVRGASDISRIDVWHGGVTVAIKTAHLCEAFGVGLEVHSGGAGNLQVLGAMSIPGQFYERGLLHPFVPYEDRTPWLRARRSTHWTKRDLCRSRQDPDSARTSTGRLSPPTQCVGGNEPTELMAPRPGLEGVPSQRDHCNSAVVVGHERADYKFGRRAAMAI